MDLPLSLHWDLLWCLELSFSLVLSLGWLWVMVVLTFYVLDGWTGSFVNLVLANAMFIQFFVRSIWWDGSSLCAFSALILRTFCKNVCAKACIEPNFLYNELRSKQPRQWDVLVRWGVRVAEGARLESVYTVTPYRGFESRPHRQ